MNETKVLTVFTGGTIGSAPKDGFLKPGGETSRKMLLEYFAKEKQAFYEKRFQTNILFETVCPYEILSENLDGNHLELLWQAVKEGAEKDYNGILIMTGTDTLAYSSAAMGYLFANLSIPVVMVSANYPLSDERSNGFDNFEGAMLLILERKHKGVFCSYQNKDAHYMHYATRLLPQDNYSDRVSSVKDCFYAKLEKDPDGFKWLLKENEEPGKAGKDRLLDVTALSSLKCEKMEDAVVWMQKPFPGMHFYIPDHCNAILLDTYHSGTLPVKESGFHQFVHKAAERNIPVFIAGVENGITYETIDDYEKAGAYILPPASPAAMYVKLWLLIANGLDAAEYMRIPFGHDVVS